MPKKLTQEEFLERAIELHKNRYDYSKVEYNCAIKKVTIICKIHGEFQQHPYAHLQGNDCGKCGKIKASNTRKMGKDEFIRKSVNVHGDKYEYTKVEYKSSKVNVTITCKNHGDFDQTPNSHTRGHGCSNCGLKIISEKGRRNNDMFIEKAIKSHGNKYDYNKVDYKLSKSKVTIICSRHGEFTQIARDHENGSGCPKCANEEVSKKLLSNTVDFIKKANVIHNNKYDYSLVNYVNNRENVAIICKEHGEFKQIPNSHLSGQGCPLCKNKTEGFFTIK